MTHGSLFSGIGGFDLAAQWMGWENVFHVERDPFCRQVLTHHFPESQSFDDVKTFDATHFRGRVSVISGGFPCQPFSAAGKRAGTSDDRYLWPEMFRIIREARPTYVVAENVRGLLSWNEGLVLDTVCSDLEGEGYEVLPVVLGAASVNAPHRRDRIWIVAYNQGQRWTGKGQRRKEEKSWVRSDGTTGTTAYATNACGMGRERRRSEEAEGREGQRLGVQPHVEGQGSGADAPHANAVRLQLSQNAGEVGRRQSEVRRQGHQPTQPIEATRAAGYASDPVSDERPKGGRDSNRSKAAEGHAGLCDARPRTWEDFPSVAPVCGGDDGLPERLDGITFPKWRRESIKAYGNAIVPQVALQIFQALEDIDRRTA